MACFLKVSPRHPCQVETTLPILALFLLPNVHTTLQPLKGHVSPQCSMSLPPRHPSARNPSLHIVQLAISGLSIQLSSSSHWSHLDFGNSLTWSPCFHTCLHVNQLHFFFHVSKIVTLSCLKASSSFLIHLS